jgi:hypothetical protein
VAINHNVFHVVIVKEIVPGSGIRTESVFKHKQNIRIHLADFLTALTVVILENLHIRVFPRLVSGLNSVKSGVHTVHLHKVGDVVDAPLNVAVVNAVIKFSFLVIVTHPVAGLYRPMFKVSLINPFKVWHLTRVVKTVLRSFKSVDIEENLEAILVSRVEEPLNLLSGTVHATDVRPVRSGSPVTNRKTDDLNFPVSKVLDKVLSDPRVPMGAHDFVTFHWTESLAESVRIKTNTFRLAFPEEAVEERGGDPGFEDHPSSDIGTDSGALFSDGNWGKSCKSNFLKHK